MVTAFVGGDFNRHKRERGRRAGRPRRKSEAILGRRRDAAARAAAIRSISSRAVKSRRVRAANTAINWANRGGITASRRSFPYIPLDPGTTRDHIRPPRSLTPMLPRKWNGRN